MKTTSRPQRNSPYPSQNWRGDMRREESSFHCFTGRREGERLLRGGTQAGRYPLNTFSNIHTYHIYNASKTSENFAVFHRGKLLSSSPQTQTIIFCYTVLVFYVFPPVQIKPHVRGLKSNKTYLLQYGSLKIKYKHRKKSKTILLQKKIKMPTRETPV